MFGRLEDSSWFTYVEDASVLANQTHFSCTIPPKPYTRTAFVAGSAVRLATDMKTAPVNGSSIRPCFYALRAASHLLVGRQQRQNVGTAPR